MAFSVAAAAAARARPRRSGLHVAIALKWEDRAVGNTSPNPVLAGAQLGHGGIGERRMEMSIRAVQRKTPSNGIQHFSGQLLVLVDCKFCRPV